MEFKNRLFKISIVLIISVICISTVSFAEKYTPSKFGDAIDTSGTEEIEDVGGQILGIIRVVGTIVAVGMLMIIGIKYMMGSADEKAAYRKSLLPYVIGAVLIFAASSLADMVYTWATNL